MRQRFPARFLVRGIKNEAVLQFARNQHFGDGIREPFLDFSNHVVHIGVDEAVEFVWPEAEPRYCLQEAISALVGTPARHDELPELVAVDLRVLAWPAKLPDKIRSSFGLLHAIPRYFSKIIWAIFCATC